MKQDIFKAEQFTPTEWDTAETKAKFANHFVRFVKEGFSKRLFTSPFYRRLSMTFGHIAHYNQLGFWEEFFDSSKGKVDFIAQSLEWPCYGSPTHTYSDVERALQNWLKENQVLAQVITAHNAVVEAVERLELERLQQKYEGIPNPASKLPNCPHYE